MSRTTITVALAAAVAGLFAPPALAQDAASSSNERVNQIIVYGSDPCPRATSPDEITVCARKDEGERFRIPEQLRDTESPQNRAWTDRVLAYETVGNFGTNSCSPVGAGGFTGCTQQLVRQAYAERETGPQVRFSDLIAQERAKRLSTIDQDARDTQARVEAAERDYAARQGSMSSDDASDAQTATKPATHPAPGAQ